MKLIDLNYFLQTATGGEIIFSTNPAPVEVFGYIAVTLGNDTRLIFNSLLMALLVFIT
jgi:hypothetical protein